MAVCYIDDSIIAVSSDKLREYAARGTTLELYDFMEEKSYSVRVGKEENSVIRFVLDGAHDIPSLYMSSNVAYGETIGLSGGEMDGTISGFVQKDADGLTIMPEVVAATRPASRFVSTGSESAPQRANCSAHTADQRWRRAARFSGQAAMALL